MPFKVEGSFETFNSSGVNFSKCSKFKVFEYDGLKLSESFKGAQFYQKQHQ